MRTARTPDPAGLEVRAAAAAAADWPSLAARARGCTACPELAASRQQVVVGQAPPGVEVLLVGEAPGAAEDRTGEPFVGRSGELLDRLLAEAGLPREAVAVANLLKCRPPRNRPPRADEVGRCRGWLDRQVALLDPRLVVTLGGSAATWALGPGTRIGAVRGQLRQLAVDGRPLLATYHPSAAIRFGPRGAPLAALREDLALAAALVAGRASLVAG